MKKFLLGVLGIVAVFSLAACGEKEEVKKVDENTESTTIVSSGEVSSKEEVGTAGSNIPLKDNAEKAKEEVTKALTKLMTTGENSGNVEEVKIVDIKIYSSEDEKEVEPLAELNLSADEVAFEAEYELKIAEGVDGERYTDATGKFDEETRWVTEKFNLGTLKLNEDGEYVINNFGTGW